MNILAFTDLHGSKKHMDELLKLAPKADLIICCGDISDFGHGTDKILLKFIETQRPFIAIHGNHESEEIYEKLAEEHPNFIYLHKSSVRLGDIFFFGYGGGGFAIENPEIEYIAHEVSKKVPAGAKLVTITHGPPHNTNLDRLDNNPTGCKSIRKIIEGLQPVVHLCGHIHENAGKEDRIKDSLVLNPGPKGKLIRI